MIFNLGNALWLLPFLGYAAAGKPTSSSSTCDATITQITGNAPVIDGDFSATEWAGAAEVPMHLASSERKDVLAIAHILASCEKWYVAVLTTGNGEFIEKPDDLSEAFMKLNGNIPPVILHEVILDSVGVAIGWEAVYEFPYDASNVELKVHSNVFDGSQTQTAGTPGTAINACFNPDCDIVPVEPEPEPQPEPEPEPTPECGNDEDCKPADPLSCQVYFCDAGTCAIKDAPDGEACGTPGDECMEADSCSSGQCVSGLPLSKGTSCGSGDSDSCNKADTCDGEGQCLPNLVPEGQSCNPGFEVGECTSYKCSADGTCVEDPHAKDGDPCGNAGSDCMLADSCSVGVCVPGAFVDAGTSCGSGDSDSCNKADTCDGAGQCLPNLEPEGQSCDPGFEVGPCMEYKCSADGTCVEDPHAKDGDPCGDAATDCMLADSCSVGVCKKGLPVDKGASCGSGDSTSCDKADMCDGTGQCVPNMEPEGTSCDPGFAVAECMDYKCSHDGKCIEDPHAKDGAPCGSEGDMCTSADSCSVGVCVPGPFLAANTPCGSAEESTCDMADTCNGAGQCVPNHKEEGLSCDPGFEVGECMSYKCGADGTCIEDPVAKDGLSCGSPGDQCTNADSCSNGKCVFGGFVGENVSCGSAETSPCDMADMCNGAGECVPNYEPEGTACIPEEMNALFDSQCVEYKCTVDGNCVADPIPMDGGACGSGGDECTKPDYCSQGKCVFGGYVAADMSCGDASDTTCDNPDTCDGAGKCISNFEPQGTMCEPDMVSDNECVEYKCDMAGGCVAVNLAPGTACGYEGDECTIADSCQAGVCVVGGPKAKGTECGNPFEDSCNEKDTCDGKGSCQANLVPDNTLCGSPETPCMNPDVCSAGVCLSGLPKPSGTLCGGDMEITGECDLEDTCDGAGECLANHVADGTSCGAPPTQCSFGSSCKIGQCVFEGHKPETTTCGPAPSGICDSQDYCSGNGACVDYVKFSSFVCRPAADTGCDVEEMCDGSSKLCPEDSFMAAGTACGSAMETECDKPDTCDAHGQCLMNLAPEDSPCGNKEDQCNFADSCHIGECVDGGFKPSTTKCGDFDPAAANAACDVQDYCNAGSCEAKVEPAGTLCRAAKDECDVPEVCDGSSKSCPTDSFAAMGTLCGATGSDLEYCEIQDECDGNGSCSDNGVEPTEYAFKCGTTNYLCGDDLADPAHAADVCNDGVDQTVIPDKAACDDLIRLALDPTVNTYSVKCPNGKGISHWTYYDCQGYAGYKCEAECSSGGDAEGCPVEDLIEDCGKCNRRNLRSTMKRFLF